MLDTFGRGHRQEIPARSTTFEANSATEEVAQDAGPPMACTGVAYSTVTDLARFRGLSTSWPRCTAAWYANNYKGITVSIGLSGSLIAGTRKTKSA